MNMAAKKAAAPKQSAVVKKPSAKAARVKTDGGSKKDSGVTEAVTLVTEAASQLRDAVDRLRLNRKYPGSTTRCVTRGPLMPNTLHVMLDRHAKSCSSA